MELSYKVEDAFAKWAKGFSGISGGNPNAELWFCGIEFGGESALVEFKEDQYLDKNKEGIPSWGEKYLEKFKGQYIKWQYMQKIAKLALAYRELPLTSYREYIDQKLCRANGEVFLMNLYPLNFIRSADHLWTYDHYRLTGFPNKRSYMAWCMQNRFPILKNLLITYKPKVLICTGVEFENDFKLAFLDKENLFREGQSHLIKDSKNKICKIYKTNGIKIIIAPFFGRGGIMADKEICEIANLAKEKYCDVQS